MTVGCEADVGLPLLTNTADHTKYTMRLTCVDPYQTLPYHTLAERNPLVVLVWSTNCYHLPDLGRNLGQNTITNHYHREGGQGIKPNRPSRVGQYRCGGCHMGSRVEGIHSVAQRGEPYTPSEVGHTARSVSERKKFSEWSWSHSIL